jgi:hypothetical protein
MSAGTGTLTKVVDNKALEAGDLAASIMTTWWLTAAEATAHTTISWPANTLLYALYHVW